MWTLRVRSPTYDEKKMGSQVSVLATTPAMFPPNNRMIVWFGIFGPKFLVLVHVHHFLSTW